MKKNRIAAAVAGALVIGGSSAGILAGTDGYKLYKEALKNTHTIERAYVTMEGAIIDNGEILQTTKMEAAYNIKDKIFQGKASLYDQAFNFSYQDDALYLRNEEREKTFVIPSKYSKEEQKEIYEKYHNPELMMIMEETIDTLTLPLHHEFKLREGNGEKQIHIQLENGDIPRVLKVLGNHMIRKGTEAHEGVILEAEKYPVFSEDITMNMPALVDDIEIKNVEIEAVLTDDNIIKKQKLKALITGTDENDKSHHLEMQFIFSFSNINNQELYPLEMEGNELEVLDLSEIGGGHHF